MEGRPAHEGSVAGPPPGSWSTLERAPRAVWLATLLLGLTLAAYSVVTPLFNAPDEFLHLDLVVALADDPHYPQYDERRVSGPVQRVAGAYYGRTYGKRGKPIEAAPPASDRQDIDSYGGPEFYYPGANRNQQPQHPPLYYQLMAMVLRVERALHPGAAPPALVTELMVLRLVNALLVATLPLAAWCAARRLRLSARAGIAAALAVCAVPQLAHVGASLNNDNLLVALAAWLTVALAGVVRGDLGRRTAVVAGLLLAAALLTKALALVLVPWVVVAYLLGWVVRRDGRAAVVSLGIVGGLALVLSGWWWVGNLRRHGALAPSLEDALIPTRPGFDPDALWWLRYAGRYLPQRFWGSMASYTVNLPLPLVVVATLGLVGLVAVALLRGEPRSATDAETGSAASDAVAGADAPTASPTDADGSSTGVASGPTEGRWTERLGLAWLALLPLGLAAITVQHAWALYARSGRTPFLQGRYLFAGLVCLAVLVAVGLSRIAGWRAPLVALVSASVLQAAGLHSAVRAFWGGEGDGLRAELRAMATWSVLDPWAVAVLGALVVAAGLSALVVLARDVTTRPGPWGAPRGAA